MKEDKFYKGIEDLKKLRLPRDKKQMVFNRLNHYATGKIENPQTNSFWGIFIYSRQFSYVALAMVFMIGSGGLIVASDNSLPGDLLYSVKVNISEPLQGVATFSTASKVSWESEKVQTRLEEVEILVAQGKLNSTVREQVQNRLEQQTKSFYKVVQDSEQKNREKIEESEDAQVDFESKIVAHNRILEKLENHSDSDQKEEVVKFRSKMSGNTPTPTVMAMGVSESSVEDTSVDNSKDTSKSFFADSSEKVASTEIPKQNKSSKKISTTTLDREEKAIEVLIKNTEDSLNKNLQASSTLQADIMLETKDGIEQAKESLKIAREKKDLGDLSGAREDLKNSRRSIENAGIFLKQSIKLEKEKNKYKRRTNR